jgi:hypothetical protein
MARRILLVLFAVGAIAGFGCGFAHLREHSYWRHREFEDRVADVCTRAAERVYEKHDRHPE